MSPNLRLLPGICASKIHSKLTCQSEAPFCKQLIAEDRASADSRTSLGDVMHLYQLAPRALVSHLKRVLSNTSINNLSGIANPAVRWGSLEFARGIAQAPPGVQVKRDKVEKQKPMAVAMEPEVLEEAFGPVRVATLNRPKALNSLNTTMMKQLAHTLRKWEARPHAQVIILKGGGPPGRAFCAGGDVRAVYEMGKAGRIEECKEFFRWEYNVNNFLAEMKTPVIAWMDGVTMGGGCGVSLNGPIRIATENTVCAMPECAIGLHPDVGASYFLNHRSPLMRESPFGTYLALTGARLDGANMLALGLATHWMPSERLPMLIDRLSALHDFSREGVESVLYETTEMAPIDHSDPSVSILARRSVIDECFLKYSVEHIMGALRKAAERPGHEWVNEVLANMQKGSPTSLKITQRSLERGRGMTLDKALKQEYRLTYRCLEKPDFYEGVRAMLVDKDMKPKWHHKSLTEVKPSELAWYSSPLPEGEELEFELDKMLEQEAAKSGASITSKL